MHGFAVYQTPIGWLKLDYEAKSIIGIQYLTQQPMELGLKTGLTEQAIDELMDYLKGKRKVFTFPYKLKGTSFQEKVWHALEQIPYGQTRTYKEIAEIIGNPKASRAVGMANHRNPLMIVIPCHRVIGAKGKLTGYAGGLSIKLFLLELEKENS